MVIDITKIKKTIKSVRKTTDNEIEMKHQIEIDTFDNGITNEPDFAFFSIEESENSVDIELNEGTTRYYDFDDITDEMYHEIRSRDENKAKELGCTISDVDTSGLIEFMRFRVKRKNLLRKIKNSPNKLQMKLIPKSVQYIPK